MNKEIADKWIAALRSGEYKQAPGKLRVFGPAYCCLGVLCEVLNIEYDDNDMWLPFAAQKVSDMKSNIGLLSVETGSLASLNDRGMSFNNIANLIEHNWEQL